MLLVNNPEPAQLLSQAQGRVPANESSCALSLACLDLVDSGEPRHGFPPLLGICGAQGSGKSTLCELIALAMAEWGTRPVVVLSLDDFYRTRAERQALAATIHPLCATRGVPGTHDVALLDECLSRLLGAGDDEIIAIPRFDKLADDRLPREKWAEFRGRPGFIVIEGWCIGITADRLPPWQGPLNALERECDPQGEWLAWSREELKRGYATLWKMLDGLVGIRQPDMESVIASRIRQEEGLRAARGPGAKAMSPANVRRFVEHYERYTLALASALPAIADLLVERDADFNYHIQTAQGHIR
ncbi:kinase [Altererythrobacter sp. BO-6]|uniref:kinase n=1 Tax=Altererythrobacter sp. BO-6 TaxID=2604537 RepID=UPI0013E10790|nr:kinase [Altererythrobacter sp. BO-6]QIG54566.1 kinase [Altererythrobacter sp. BO-6]